MPNIQNNPLDKMLDAATLKPEKPRGMLENHPDLTPDYARTVYTDDHFSEKALKGAVNEAVLDVIQEANTDGQKNVVMIEANIPEGKIGVVSYAATSTEDFVQGQSESIKNTLNLQVAFVDNDASDDDKQIRLGTQPGSMLAQDPKLTPVQARRFEVADFYSKSEMQGAVTLEAIKVAQAAASDGKMNVVTIETNVQNGNMSVVNYEATDTADYTEGDELNLEGFVHIKIVGVDGNIADDAEQILLNLDH